MSWSGDVGRLLRSRLKRVKVIDGASFVAPFRDLISRGDNLVPRWRKVGCNNAQIQT